MQKIAIKIQCGRDECADGQLDIEPGVEEEGILA
jgi:hypothetical protein